MVLALQILYFKMWLWILIGLSIITKVHGYSSGDFPEVCQSMSPDHSHFTAQKSEPPFEVTYKLGKSGEPITVNLQSKTSAKFRGFMLEARVTGMVEESPPVGTFILLDTYATRLLTCGNQAGSAVSQRFNHPKSVIKVNWIAPAEELNVTFRATFVQDYRMFWERVDEDVIPPPTTTAPPPTTAASTTKPTTATSIIQPTTAASTTKPTTATSIVQPTTAASTTKPTTATSIIKPTTTISTKVPRTTSTTKQSKQTAKPIPTIPKLQRAGSALMAFDILFVGLKMAQAHIMTTTSTNSFRSRRLITVSKIPCRLICAAVEISSMMLFAVAQPFNVTLVALVCVVLLINFIEVVTDSVSVGLSHKLKGICNVAVKVCSVIHLILSRSSRQNEIWSQQREKRTLSTAAKIATAISVILIVGTMSFTAAVIGGIFSGKQS
ncbi:probable transcription-associated protein 1 isoform X2 [Sparus aurata]|uniref:probable transcription-associated protein 1 isoform X2 n=1 Tax=Sparus aurata TaxID=8175 RepID=UPI0011C15837|nr:probable transcription-associated protein 1 isoform X2 [Sparus aurata]